MADTHASAIDLLARLIAFDTTSHKTNLPLLEFVEEYLARFGIASQRVANQAGDKASLFATIGPTDVPGIALSGHTDVVPVADQDWQTDPFTMVERDGRLYGRGTTDMKGFLACVLAAVPKFCARELKTPIHIVFSYDEEIGCVGVRPLVRQLGKRFPVPRAVIVGEPTLMSVVDAHKGPVRWEIDVTGRAAHSSMAPLGVNAVEYAARVIAELSRIEKDLMQSPRDDRFEPPYSTLQVTSIEGGTANNIVPATCRVGFEVRALPGLDTAAAVEERLNTFIEAHCLEDMRRVSKAAGIVISTANQVPPFAATASSDAVAMALQLIESNETFAVSYATEAGLFQDAGAPAVVCGPGDIAQAHTANEWISTDEIAKCDAFMSRLADAAARPS